MKIKTVAIIGAGAIGSYFIAGLTEKDVYKRQTLDMSSINDPEQLTGSSRIYSNAKPGIIMEAFSVSGQSNLGFIINELDKAAAGKGNGNPADVLLTLLDNLGFTDNYMECMVPTVGVYPVSYTHLDVYKRQGIIIEISKKIYPNGTKKHLDT